MPEQPETGRRVHRGRRAPVLAVKTTTRLHRPALTGTDDGASRQPRSVGRRTPSSARRTAAVVAGPDWCRRRRRTAVLEHRGLRSAPRTYFSPKRLRPSRHLLWESAVLDRKVRPRSGEARSTGTFDAVGDILRERVRVAPAGDILQRQGHFRTAGGIRRRRGQESCPRTRGVSPVGTECPRTRGMSPAGGVCPRPREASPPKDAQPLGPGPSSPHTHRAGPRTWWDPARRRSDEARSIKQQPRPAPRHPSCRPRCAPAP